MEGFKKLPKMQCFKVGGSVAPKFKSVVEKTTAVKPTGNKLAKAKSAAVAPTEKEAPVQLTGLKKGGRVKKAVGTVKRFVMAPSKAATKTNFKGSDVAKEKSKPAGDKDAIKKVKPTGNKKAAAPSKAAVKGKDIKKFADGGLTGNLPPAMTPLQTSPDTSGQPIGFGPNDGGFPSQQPNYNPGTTFNNSNTMNAGGGFGGGGYPNMPMQPPTQQPYGGNTFNNTNTMNAGSGGFGGGGVGDVGGGGFIPQTPSTNPWQGVNTSPTFAYPQSEPPQGSVSLLPSLFGGK